MANYNDDISDKQITEFQEFLCECEPIEGVGRLYECRYDNEFISFALYFLNNDEISEDEYKAYKTFS